MKGLPFKTLGGLAALLLLGWLYQQSAQVNPSLHVRTVTHFEQLRQQDAQLNQYVLQSRYNLLRNYDPVVSSQQRIHELLNTLQQDKPDDFSPGETPIQQEFTRYRKLFETKFAVVEAFKSHNAVLRNSLRYFPLAVQHLIDLPGSDPKRNALLHNLLESVLLFDNAPSDGHQLHIEQVMGQLLQLDPKNTEAMGMLARHVGIILEFQRDVNQYTRDITQAQSTAAGDTLFAMYSQRYTERQQKADRFRLALALLAVAMLAYLAWMLTALQRARRSLQGSLRELKFQKFALDTHSIVSVADRSGKILEINDKFTEISQYSREELIGQDHRVLNSGYHPHDFFKTMWTTIGHGQVWHNEVKNRRKDGTFYWVDSTIVPFMDEAGKVLRYVSIRTDITKRKAADELLTQQGRFYERISETLGEGIYVQDVDGRCIYMNSEAERLLGWSREEFLGRPVHNTIHTQTADGTKLHGRDCAIMQAIQQTGSAMLEDQVFVRKDGTVFPVALTSRASTNAQGKMETLVVAFSDITERKQTELAMRQAKEAAEQAARVKGDFLANMSHEIRTPMNGVIGMIDVLQQSSLNASQMEMTHIIHDSAYALLAVINDILDFSKIEANKLDTESIPLSISDVVESACNNLSQFALKKAVRLSLFVDPTIPETVLGDPGRVRQVLINLTNNAIKFSAGQARPGSVTVRVLLTQSDPQRVLLTFHVLDNGIGIDEVTRTKLFTAFTQADTSTTRKFGGTGLGLAISGQLVKLMGGEIEVFSGLDHGSDFSFCLPFPLAAASSPPPAPLNLVSGLPCLVMTSPDDLADDVATYLRHAQMVVSRAPDLTSALLWLQVNAGGVVLAFDDDDDDPVLKALRAQALAHPEKMWRFVSIGHGQRRRPRSEGADLVLIDGNLLTRKTLLDTVAIAVGRSDLPDWDHLPVVAQPAVKPMSREAAVRKGSLILIAEDNEYNQKVIMQQLMLLGRTADVANNGQEALTRWQTGAYAILITDLHMPLMDGYELTAAIRSAEAGRTRIPIIAFTANALKGEAERCKAIGMDDYLSKPVQLDQLKQMLKKWQPVVLSTAFEPAQTRLPLAVDVSVLAALIGSEPTVIREFLQDFGSSATQIAADLRHACLGREPLLTAAAAHKLKSAARSVGALALGQCCEAMELAGKAGDVTQLTGLLPQFEQELDRVQAFLQTY